MITWSVGRVISVDPTATDASGNPTPKVNVLSFMDGSRLSIPVAPAAWEQHLPVEGMHVLYIRYGNRGNQWSRIVKMWGVGAPTDRKGVYSLDAGEVFIQAPAGLGFLKIDQYGNVSLVTGDTTASLDMSSDGVIGDAHSFQFTTPGGISFLLNDDGSVQFQRADTNGNVLASFSMDLKNNIMFEAKADVTIKATNIYLDGNVWAGPNASNQVARLAFGDVVTGGVLGTHAFDYTTGAPILGSTTVKAAS
jgi:hypothetical protein